MAKALERMVFPVERLQKEHGVSWAEHMGACVLMGWDRGKEVTESEYTAALAAFRKHPAGRRKNA